MNDLQIQDTETLAHARVSQAALHSPVTPLGNFSHYVAHEMGADLDGAQKKKLEKETIARKYFQLSGEITDAVKQIISGTQPRSSDYTALLDLVMFRGAMVSLWRSATSAA